MAYSVAKAESTATGAGQDVRVLTSLRWFAYAAAVCTSSGTLLYCYGATLGSTRQAMVVIHEVSGDGTAVLLGVYLWKHVQRIWRLRKTRPLSWWTGMLGLATWTCATITGIYGQWSPIDAYAAIWWLHAIGSFAAVAITCFHAAYGYREVLFPVRETR